MRRGKFLPKVLACLALLAMADAARGQAGAEPRALEPSKLYLNRGTIDTRAALSGPNLLTVRPRSYRVGQPYVLQMDGPMTPQRRAALLEAGVTPGDYIPLNAYIVDLGGVSPRALEELPFVSWVGVYRDEWKLPPTMGQGQAAPRATKRAVPGEQARLRLTVVLFKDRDLEAGKQRLAQAGATVLGGGRAPWPVRTSPVRFTTVPTTTPRA